MKCDKSGMFIRTTRMAMRKYDQLAASYSCYKPTRMTCIEVLQAYKNDLYWSATSLQEWPVLKCTSPQGLHLVLATSLASFPSSVVHVWLVLPLHYRSGQDESTNPELLYHLSDWICGPSRWEADWLYARWRCLPFSNQRRSIKLIPCR